ncbi:MAG TPA: hypothetical protein VNH65_14935 [Candidatus Acidoferrum sp.]|nr:hypothetical protein [Candidatus Acidoferrum sp.]
MESQQEAGRKQKGYWGKAFVTGGLAALLADLAFLAQPLEKLAERLRDGHFGFAPALGLSFLAAARAIAFHQIDYFSLISRILVLFSAMTAIVIGIFLQRSHSTRATRAAPLRASAFREKETDNGSSR